MSGIFCSWQLKHLNPSLLSQTAPVRSIPSSALLLTGAIAARLSMKVFADASGTALMRLTTSRKTDDGADAPYDVAENYGGTDAPYHVAVDV